MNEDTLQKREAMVRDQIEARGIKDQQVLAAMRSVPRERFATMEVRDQAYEDRALPTQDGQTMSQPYIVALMCEAARLQPTDRVLEIGTGSGYSAAVLSNIVHRVWTLERNPKLARFSGSRIAELGHSNVTVLRSDGTNGWPPAAPFDAILVTATGPQVPDTLKQQLVVGGRLVMPEGPLEGPQKLVRVVRESEDRFSEEALLDVNFVPLIGEHGWTA
jgi:protein-L-isoaspartate(D-aspartate) O-methyltransferase